MILPRAAFACFLMIAATPASAQPADAQAEAMFHEGRSLMAAGMFAKACAAFEQSQRLEQRSTTLFHLATCREELGQLATAWALFLDIGQQTRPTSDSEAAQLHAIALERAAKLESRVPKLSIHVPDKSRIEGLEILRDNEIVRPEMWNRELPVDGGTYIITARARGRSNWSTRVTLASEADTKTIHVPNLRYLGASADERSNAPFATNATKQSAKPWVRDLILTMVSLGPVLLVSSVGLSLWSDMAYDDAKSELINQARRDQLFDLARYRLHLAEGLAVAGIGCAGVAVWLYLRQRSTRAKSGHVMLAPTGLGVGVVARF